jgi:hypothetical protein
VAANGAPGFLEGRRDTTIALTPFAALVLFFITHSWLWFLMVPVMGLARPVTNRKASSWPGLGAPDQSVSAAVLDGWGMDLAGGTRGVRQVI